MREWVYMKIARPPEPQTIERSALPASPALPSERPLTRPILVPCRSADGLEWHWGGGHPAWTTTLKTAAGEVKTCRDAERPRVFVNPHTRRPELLFTASGGDHQPSKPGDPKSFLVVQRIGSTGGNGSTTPSQPVAGDQRLLKATSASVATQQADYTVEVSSPSTFPHVWEECVGSGHASLTLRADWRAHLTRVSRSDKIRSDCAACHEALGFDVLHIARG